MGGLNSTKQMLDDLDALMERMLALPMDDAEASVPAPAAPPKRPALAATLTMLPPVEKETPPKPSNPLQGPHADFSTPPVKPAAAPDETPVEEEAPIPPPLAIRRLDTIESPAPLLPAPPRTFFLWRPLLWVNQAYDQATRLLGPLGRLLRSTPVRLILGGVGLVLLGTAAAWLTRDWLTWTR